MIFKHTIHTILNSSMLLQIKAVNIQDGMSTTIKRLTYTTLFNKQVNTHKLYYMKRQTNCHGVHFPKALANSIGMKKLATIVDFGNCTPVFFHLQSTCLPKSRS